MAVPAEMFKALAVDSRVKIIELLKAKGPLGVKNISESLGITPAAVSQHLKILKQAGLLRNERQGYWIPYSIDEEALENYRQVLNEVCTCGCEKTFRLREKELRNQTLESLKAHEVALRTELKAVQAKIQEMESTKGMK